MILVSFGIVFERRAAHKIEINLFRCVCVRLAGRVAAQNAQKQRQTSIRVRVCVCACLFRFTSAMDVPIQICLLFIFLE